MASLVIGAIVNAVAFVELSYRVSIDSTGVNVEKEERKRYNEAWEKQ